MRANFTRFDDALIERVFQPIADSITCRIGLDRLRIAAVCLDAASIAWILSRAGALAQAVLQWDPGTALSRTLLLLLGLVALTSLRTVFRRVGAGSGANPLRVAMLPHRGVVLALLLVRLPALPGFAGMADLAMLGLAACALYLGACVAQPPGQRRAQWFVILGAR